jgi:hypothetical protein
MPPLEITLSASPADAVPGTGGRQPNLVEINATPYGVRIPKG